MKSTLKSSVFAKIKEVKSTRRTTMALRVLTHIMIEYKLKSYGIMVTEKTTVDSLTGESPSTIAMAYVAAARTILTEFCDNYGIDLNTIPVSFEIELSVMLGRLDNNNTSEEYFTDRFLPEFLSELKNAVVPSYKMKQEREERDKQERSVRRYMEEILTKHRKSL